MKKTAQILRKVTSKNAVVFIHGYKGAFLKDSITGKTPWLSLGSLFTKKQVLQFQNKGIAASGVLDAVQIIPYLYQVDIYRKFVEALNSALPTEYQVVPFYYDWRGDIQQHAVSLNRLVDQLKKEGRDKIHIIAHSLGGLISSYFLRYGDQELQSAKETWDGAKMISSIIFGGVPFRGTARSLKDLFQGETILFNKSLLNKKTLRTFPIAYQLLPFETKMPFYNGDKKGHLDIYNAKHWELLKLHSGNNQLHFILQQIKRHKRFHGLLHSDFDNEPPQHLKALNIIGDGKKTLTKPTIQLKESESLISFSDAPQGYRGDIIPTSYENGDGTVSAISAKIPRPFTGFTEEIFKQSEHSSIFNHKSIQSRVVSFIKNGC